MTRFSTSPHPIREALKGLVRKEPPDFVKGYDLKQLTDQQMLALQDWCSLNVRPQWATGLSVIEAAELMVAGAVENGNILSAEEAAKNPPPDLERCQADLRVGQPIVLVRCNRPPQAIVEETGPDALKGRMSLCGTCLRMFKQVHGVRGYQFTPIKKPREKREASSRGTRIDGTTRIGE
jgi:hypothetical protein